MKDSLPKLTEKAQKVFNAWVRRRDTIDDTYCICISCGRGFSIFKNQIDGGHYVPVNGGSFLRFHEWNVNAECKGCNGFDKFHLIPYRKNLIEKIGLENVEWLEANRRTVKKWSRSELLEIIEKYKP
jgi:hypothetical protein